MNSYLQHVDAHWQMGNTNNQVKHALTLKIILGILKFIINYAEQYAILLPGRIPGFKRDDVKILPSSDTRKVMHLHTQSFNQLNFIHTNIFLMLVQFCALHQDNKPRNHTVDTCDNIPLLPYTIET